MFGHVSGRHVCVLSERFYLVIGVVGLGTVLCVSVGLCELLVA